MACEWISKGQEDSPLVPKRPLIVNEIAVQGWIIYLRLNLNSWILLAMAL
jgi:hypothetical protein